MSKVLGTQAATELDSLAQVYVLLRHAQLNDESEKAVSEVLTQVESAMGEAFAREYELSLRHALELQAREPTGRLASGNAFLDKFEVSDVSDDDERK